LNSLPVQIVDNSLENIIFNFFEVNTFFVVGKKNTSFAGDDEQNSESADKVLENEILIEKFYVNNGDDLTSKTLGYLQLHEESVQNYCIS
jgi:hypothetical protein